jgi:mannose-6-phosphate isomerase-like protein (cupin superfamily)
MGIIDEVRFGPMVGDPDDHRPNTQWAMVVDPERDDGRHVNDVTVLFERMAPGDRIPLHTHTMSEAVVIESGRGDYTLGDERREVRPGSCVLIPSGMPHALVNTGVEELRLTGFFPSTVIDITYLERNPAPETEGQPPQPPTTIDVRRLT